MCAVVAVGATLLTLVTTLVLGNILREMAIEMFDTLRGWWARVINSRNWLGLDGLRLGVVHLELKPFGLPWQRDQLVQEADTGVGAVVASHPIASSGFIAPLWAICPVTAAVSVSPASQLQAARAFFHSA